MPSLRQLLAAHAPLLLLDAASSRVQVGWFPTSDPAAAIWSESEEVTGIGLFRCIASLAIDLGAAKSFAFCSGPGSVLGIRTCAVALRMWSVLTPRVTFSYCSLAVVAHALNRPDRCVIADARRELWHRFSIGDTLKRVPVAELTGPMAMPADFRYWSKPPANVETVPYSLAALLQKTAETDLFTASSEPDAFLHEEPSYVTWTPNIHRAPESPKSSL